METFEYMAVNINLSKWSGKPNEDYLDILNEYGSKGWKFIQIAPQHFRPKKGWYMEMIFERKISKDSI